MATDQIEERSNRDGDTFRYVLTERGTLYSHWECMRKAKAAEATFARWFSRAVKTRTTWADAESTAQELQEVRWRLEMMQEYVEAASKHLDEIEGVDRREERIKALRNVTGRTPEEAAVYLEKAAQLEART